MNCPSPFSRVAVVAACAFGLFSGCASEASKVQAKKEKAAEQAAIASGRYVWYTPVGSSIPVLVPKDQTKLSDQETVETQNALRDAQRSGQKAHGGD